MYNVRWRTHDLSDDQIDFADYCWCLVDWNGRIRLITNYVITTTNEQMIKRTTSNDNNKSALSETTSIQMVSFRHLLLVRVNGTTIRTMLFLIGGVHSLTCVFAPPSEPTANDRAPISSR